MIKPSNMKSDIPKSSNIIDANHAIKPFNEKQA